mmetsp:Transcript_9128/g.11249  ORF Transcript_9128/g.11249 Transcript_9128/m.11249 type:complete len:258 (-) Transcript_9128:357-1130(-)
MSGVYSVATSVLGPPVEATQRSCPFFIAAAMARLHVTYMGLSGLCRSSCFTSSRRHEAYVSIPASMPRDVIWSRSSSVHRYECCVVLLRDRITMGTPHSKLRIVLRNKSKKFEKFDTQPTNAGVRFIRIFGAVSSSSSASFMRRSTSLAIVLSSNSVTPSNFQKSVIWFPIKKPAYFSRSVASISRISGRKSVYGDSYDRTCDSKDCVSEDVLWIIRPLGRLNASTVVEGVPEDSFSPRRIVVTGSSYQVCGLKSFK